MTSGPGLLAAVVSAAVLTVACGSGGAGDKPHTTSAARGPSKRVPAPPQPPAGGLRSIPAPAPTGRPAGPAAVAVIRAWSDALRRGDVRAAGAYFSLPSELINGALAFELRTRAQADAASASLPCGAKLLSADQRGAYVNALFELTGRPGPGGSSCGSGAGQTARTNFVISGGHIVQWIRAPDDPGDNAPGSNSPAPPSQPTPSPTQPAGPEV
jgi:hypothetical protein